MTTTNKFIKTSSGKRIMRDTPVEILNIFGDGKYVVAERIKDRARFVTYASDITAAPATITHMGFIKFNDGKSFHRAGMHESGDAISVPSAGKSLHHYPISNVRVFTPYTIATFATR